MQLLGPVPRISAQKQASNMQWGWLVVCARVVCYGWHLNAQAGSSTMWAAQSEAGLTDSWVTELTQQSRVATPLPKHVFFCSSLHQLEVWILLLRILRAVTFGTQHFSWNGWIGWVSNVVSFIDVGLTMRLLVSESWRFTKLLGQVHGFRNWRQPANVKEQIINTWPFLGRMNQVENAQRAIRNCYDNLKRTLQQWAGM